MNRKILTAAVLLITIILALLGSYGTLSEKYINGEIKKARYCDMKSDCTSVNSQCPFGCHVIVNKNEAERIEQLINSFRSACIYDCIELKGFDCINKTCQPIY